MEHLIGGVIGGAIAALFGAYISNIFTWKIKNRIEALDITYIEALKINDLFVELYCKHKEVTTIPNEDLETFGKSIKVYIRNGYLNCFIIDGIKCGKLYEKMRLWTTQFDEILNPIDSKTGRRKSSKHRDFYILDNKPLSEVVKKYEVAFKDIQITMFNMRKKITSPWYMFGLTIIYPFTSLYRILYYCFKLPHKLCCNTK